MRYEYLIVVLAAALAGIGTAEKNIRTTGLISLVISLNMKMSL